MLFQFAMLMMRMCACITLSSALGVTHQAGCKAHPSVLMRCRCFAGVSLSMQTYDRLVSYSPRQPSNSFTEHARPNAAAGPSSSSECPEGSRRSPLTDSDVQVIGEGSASLQQQADHTTGRFRSSTPQPGAFTGSRPDAAQRHASREDRMNRPRSGRASSSEQRQPVHAGHDRKRRRRFSSRPPDGGGPSHSRPATSCEAHTNAAHSASESEPQHSTGHTAKSRADQINRAEGQRWLPSSASGHDREQRAALNKACGGKSDPLTDRLAGVQRSASREGESRLAAVQSNASSGAQADLLAKLRSRALAALQAHKQYVRD